jgi:hypothetical protein
MRGRESIRRSESKVQRPGAGVAGLYVAPYSTFFVGFRKFARLPRLSPGA